MQNMERKLYRYGELGRLIGECEAELCEEFAKKNAFLDGQLRPPAMDGVRVMGGPAADPVFEAVRTVTEVYDGRIVAAKNRLCDLMCERDLLCAKIRRAGLADQEREYLELRYGKGFSVENAARKMGYSERHVRRVRGALLEKMARVFEEDA